MNTGVLAFVGRAIQYLVDNPYILGILFLLYVFIFLLSVLFSGPRPGRNPFSVKNVKPVQELITDQKSRDQILKQRFKNHKVPKNLDVVIIGSGIGGLSVGVLLARAGKKVLVLEQHDQAGGCCHTFHDKGFEFDTGIHYIGKMDPSFENRVLMDQLTGGRVEYPLMDEAYDIVAIGDPMKGKVSKFPFVSNKEKIKENLITRFPKEKEGIEKFFKLLKEARHFFTGCVVLKVIPKWLAKLLVSTGLINIIFKAYGKFGKLSLKDVLDSVTDDEELKATLAYIFGDYGVVPSKTPFGLHSVILGHYFSGAHYIRGGPSELAFQMIQVIEEKDGRVLVNAPVSEILMSEKGRAVGVKLRKGDSDVEIFAKHVVSDAGVANTFFHLLPKEVATKSSIYPMINKVGESVSFLTVFVGLNGSKEDLGIQAHNCWHFTRPDLEQLYDEYSALSTEELPNHDVPMMFISFPSAKDPSWHETNPDKSTCLIITWSHYKWFQDWENGRVKHRGEDYESIKTAIGKRMLQQCIKLYPKMEGKVEYFDVGTPLSNKYYLGFQHGEMYGLDHNMARFLPQTSIQLRPKTDIPGLYLTGQDVMSVGLAGGLYGGLLCASALLNRNLYNDLQALQKELKKSEDTEKKQK
ncbi:all-trans-retinol 13,14-reductase-like [Crassostrea angulata]|uniref:all-trans-retinol 13,14-reductase-like n=1 Tax=Magallana angulata TaxID=2784310 RepID=UPI0022B09097|nr:all-trans-retinol 13,14-reductase-like [Crassostrea angulata]